MLSRESEQFPWNLSPALPFRRSERLPCNLSLLGLPGDPDNSLRVYPRFFLGSSYSFASTCSQLGYLKDLSDPLGTYRLGFF